MRSEPVPCIHATDYEINLGKHITWDDERLCNPCRRVLDVFAERRAIAEVEGQALERAKRMHPSGYVEYVPYDVEVESGIDLPLCSCDYRDHGAGECTCPEHERSDLHPFGEING